MLRKIILFLIRMKLGVKKGQAFQFVGQNGDARYWFEEEGIVKGVQIDTKRANYSWSRVSLYWLLSSECKIRKYVGDGIWV